MRNKIAFAGPWITAKEVEYVVDAARNGFYDNYDKHVLMLKDRVCNYLGVKYAIPTHCCTLALHLSCAALELGEGDEVICTDFSWVATAYSIVYTGATPVFVDIESDTWCISPDAIRKAITPKTKAIMLVHSFGIPAKMDDIMQIAEEHNLKVIEDAAPSLGSEFQGRKTGTFGDVACFSFQGAKVAVSGEGGVLVTNDPELYERAEHLANMGRNDSIVRFYSDTVGFQYTMANISAALALAQVERIEELVARKRDIFKWYDERLQNVEGINIIRERPGDKANYCYPSISLKSKTVFERDSILKELEKLNIHARPGFPRMSKFPALEERYGNPVAESAEKGGMSLPSAGNLTEEDIEFVCESLSKLMK